MESLVRKKLVVVGGMAGGAGAPDVTRSRPILISARFAAPSWDFWPLGNKKDSMLCRLTEAERRAWSLIGLPVITLGHYERHLSESRGGIIFWVGMHLALSAAGTWRPPCGWLHRLFQRRSA